MGIYYGVAINDYDGKVFIGGKHLKSYQSWCNMLERCYSEVYVEKYPTYEKCVVCEDWLTFVKYKEWFDLNYIEGYCLDKDLLQLDKDIKIYSPETCIFIHQTLNRMFSRKPAPSSGLPSGVEVSGNKYRARLKANGVYLSLGSFETIEAAMNVYSKHKHQHMTSEIYKYETRPKILEIMLDKVKDFI